MEPVRPSQESSGDGLSRRRRVRPRIERVIVVVSLTLITAVLVTQVGDKAVQATPSESSSVTIPSGPPTPTATMGSETGDRPDAWALPALPVPSGTPSPATPSTTPSTTPAKPEVAPDPSPTTPASPAPVPSPTTPASPAHHAPHPSPTTPASRPPTTPTTRTPRPRPRTPTTRTPRPPTSPAPVPNPPPTESTLESYYGHIVVWSGDTKTYKTAWLVGPDGHRRWIPDASTYHCLKAHGAPGPDVLSSQTLDALPDIHGVWAVCG